MSLFISRNWYMKCQNLFYLGPGLALGFIPVIEVIYLFISMLQKAIVEDYLELDLFDASFICKTLSNGQNVIIILKMMEASKQI